jgi:hypothetical protein
MQNQAKMELGPGIGPRAQTTMKISRIRTVHLLGPLLCLIPLGLSVLQDPKLAPLKKSSQEEKVYSDDDFFGTSRDVAIEGSLSMGMQGCWKLASIKSVDYPDQGIDLLGYLLISGPFMSLEVQAFWDDTLEEPPEDAFETFIGEVNPSGKKSMEVRILMGSYIDRDEGTLEWYESDRPERFAVTLPDPETLIMEWRGQRQMIFRRYRSQTQASQDFFGTGDAAGADDFYNDADDPIEEEKEPRGENEEGDERPHDDRFE